MYNKNCHFARSYPNKQDYFSDIIEYLFWHGFCSLIGCREVSVMKKIAYVWFVALLVLMGCGTASNENKNKASAQPKVTAAQPVAPEVSAAGEADLQKAPAETVVNTESIAFDIIQEEFVETMDIYVEGSDAPVTLDLSAYADYQVAIEMTSRDSLKESRLVITGNHWQRAYPIKKSEEQSSDGAVFYSALDKKEDTDQRDYGDPYLRIGHMGSILGLPLYRKRVSHKPAFAIVLYKGHWGVQYEVSHSIMLKRMRKYERYADEKKDIEKSHGKTIDQMRSDLFAVMLSSSAVRQELAKQDISEIPAEQVDRIDQHTTIFAVTH